MSNREHIIGSIFQAISAQEITRLQTKVCENESRSLLAYGYKVYSQSDEDGLIREIFNRIGTTNKYFVEIGVGNGLENNTLALLFEDWKGMWLESNAQFAEQIRSGFKATIESGRLSVIQTLVDIQNINSILKREDIPSEPDLFSIDIDGNDLQVLEALNVLRPRVIVSEYNAKFPPPIEFSSRYEPDFQWDGTDNHGASLSLLVKKLSLKGYSLVCCNLAGVNAFFVRNDLLDNHFGDDFSADYNYQPPRYYSICFFSGHPPSYDTLESYISDKVKANV